MKLIFVYNANSGILNTLLDVGHKLFSPQTYPCSLCALTYNTFSENSTWKLFRKQSNLDMEFLHINAFEKKYKNTDFKYPVVLKQENNLLSILISSNELNTLENLEALIKRLKNSWGFTH